MRVETFRFAFDPRQSPLLGQAVLPQRMVLQLATMFDEAIVFSVAK